MIPKLPFVVVTILCVAQGCSQPSATESVATTETGEQTELVTGTSPARIEKPSRSSHQRLGTFFSEVDFGNADVTTEQIQIPDFPGTFAIWGGTGRDDAGNILLAVSTVWTREARQPSARLFSYQPNDGSLTECGDVVGKLRTLGLARQETLPLVNGRVSSDPSKGEPTVCDECQMKIHSKLVTMDDGWTYFTSMDEWNEKVDGSQLPYWGSHFWRYKSEGQQWEHLKSVPEGMIAVSGVGRFLFALGYFDHVVYRLDTDTGQWERKAIGSHRGHISRNLLADHRGHAFVPKIASESSANAPPSFQVELIELDSNLNEVNATELNHYPVTSAGDAHGITGTCYLSDQSMAFVTERGRLYRIDNTLDDSPAIVTDLGWFHPSGAARTESLFCIDGKRWLAAVSHPKNGDYEWVIYDLDNKTSQSSKLDLGAPPAHGMQDVLLYGSNTRDDLGACYLVGCYKTFKRKRQFPFCLRVQWQPQSP